MVQRLALNAVPNVELVTNFELPDVGLPLLREDNMRILFKGDEYKQMGMDWLWSRSLRWDQWQSTLVIDAIPY